MDAGDPVSAADLRRAIDVREGLRAVLLQNNGHPLDEEQVARLDRAVGRAAVRVRFAPGRDPALVTDAGGVDGAIARLMAIVAAAVEHGRWERLKAPARGVRVGVLRQVEEPLEALVHDGVLRQHREGEGLPRARRARS